MAKVYVIGSLRKKTVRELANTLRDAGHDAFDQWHAAGENADQEWRDYFQELGVRYADAVESPFVKHIVEFDERWLSWADVVVACGAPGVSAAYELMWAGKEGKQTIIYLHDDPERWDAMVLLLPEPQFAMSADEILALIEG